MCGPFLPVERLFLKSSNSFPKAVTAFTPLRTERSKKSARKLAWFKSFSLQIGIYLQEYFFIPGVFLRALMTFRYHLSQCKAAVGSNQCIQPYFSEFEKASERDTLTCAHAIHPFVSHHCTERTPQALTRSGPKYLSSGLPLQQQL